MPSVPTLLVFTLGPSAEVLRHPLLPEALRESDLGLRQACLLATLEAGRQAGCRILVSSPQRPPFAEGAAWIPQSGSSFAERLEDALGTAFRSAAGPVVLVGTDSPGLDGNCIRAALAGLQDDPRKVVLGPSPDGGFYLLAARQPLDAVLSAVRWCSTETLATLHRELESAGRPVALLAPLADLDTPSDLDSWLASAPPPRARRALWLCFWSLRRTLARRRAPVPSPLAIRAWAPRRRLRPVRAPPAFASC